ncbi:hypothetical protein [Algivirga pacifica]|uniref:Uncharacterized protein n=1 Tax=Algivirga pacifica TaxID=1162670 RepID=A0ABP9DLF4_9BACT
MKILKLNNDGTLRQSDILHFGGRYSFWEKLRGKGSGTPKIKYIGGVKVLDDIILNGQTTYANIEPFKGGLVVYLNINNTIKAVGFKLCDLSDISLTAYRIEMKDRYRNKKTIVHRGKLIIQGNNTSMEFDIYTSLFKRILLFLSQPKLKSYFRYAVSLNKPEKDYAHLTMGVLGQI